MKQFLIACLLLTTFVTSWAATEAPKGHIIYCSYSNTRNDGWGRHFCELINENGKTTVVVYLYNRDMAKPDERHYEVTADVANQMETLVRDNKYYEIDGYKVFDSMMGGSTKRVYMEFETGEHINAEWFAEKPLPLAVSAYQAIAHFFTPWVEKAEKEREAAKNQVTIDTDEETSTATAKAKSSSKSKKWVSKKRKSRKSRK